VRCTDTLGYEDPEIKCQSAVHLLAVLDARESEYRGWFSGDLTARARVLFREAEQRPFLNG
jgi:hypothetical protein